MEQITSLEEILEILPSYFFSNGRNLLEKESLCPYGKGEKFKNCCRDKYEKISNTYNFNGHKLLGRR